MANKHDHGSSFRRPTRPAATAAVSFATAFALAATGGLPASAAPPEDYPTWAEVQAARQNEKATQAEIAKLERIVAQLQAQSTALQKVAMMKAEDALLAQSALEDAEAKTQRLTDQLAAAQERADQSAALAASLVAHLARAGGGDPTASLIFSSADDADLLLSRLGTMAKLSESSAALVEQAVYDKRSLTSLTTEAVDAETTRRALAEAATTASADAEKAAQDAVTQLEAQLANEEVLYAQLATLKGTTAELEREYAEGKAAQQPEPPAESGGSGSGSGGDAGDNSAGDNSDADDAGDSGDSGDSGNSGNDAPDAPPAESGGSDPAPNPGGSTAPTPVKSAVEGAIAYAKEQLGDKYQLGGMGPDVWDCSGLTKASYASVGVYIGIHSSTDQYNYMKKQGRLVPFSEALPGDLIFYSDGGSADNPRKYHVTIYLGDGMMIEAPNPTVPVRIVPARAGDRVPFVGRPTG